MARSRLTRLVKVCRICGEGYDGFKSRESRGRYCSATCLIEARRRQRDGLVLEEEPAAMEVAAETQDPLARREMTEELKRLLECVGRLEPDRQKLVLLAYYNGWSREQLAAKFETPVNTVKTWLRRSMMDIRECLGL